MPKTAILKNRRSISASFSEFILFIFLLSCIVEAVDYYTTPRGQCPNSPNMLKFTSLASVLGFDAFNLAETLLIQPLQIIIGNKQGAFGSFRDGHEFYNRAASNKKDLFILEGESHYDLYDQPEPVRQAVEKLVVFYKENL
ncbi:alpha/beta hydrolase [Lacrimispora sp. BS-2]|uniref:Alpha/beta hydrolase n=1 Tax=Lacrimispora sp. BS-2 TaxID=3151850 RepID=A0AAU7PNH6_9FIRM